jgi:urea transporter
MFRVRLRGNALPDAASIVREIDMSPLVARWERIYASVLRFADVNLRGVGQVVFQNNPLSGALFLAALGWGAFSANIPHVAIGGLSALIAATTTARSLHADETSVRAGLYGYNGVLTGLALTYFLGPGTLAFAYAVLGGVVSAIAMLGPVNADKPWRVPAHTYPFVLVTWIFLLAAQGFSGSSDAYSSSVATPIDPLASDPLRVADFLHGIFNSISQIFFKGNALSALLLLAGLAVNSFAAAGFAMGGAVLAVTVAHLFGVENELITSGLQGFSPVLTAVALGTVFYQPSFRIVLFAALGTVAAVVAQSALDTALAPMGLPALSAPFDLVAWIFFVSSPCRDTQPRSAANKSSLPPDT